MHRLTAQIFPYRGPQNGAAIAVPRKGCHPRSFEMQIPPLAPCVCGFAQKDGAAVSQLRHIDAELMAGIEHGKRLHARREHAAPEEGGKFRPFGLVGREIDEIGSGGD